MLESFTTRRLNVPIARRRVWQVPDIQVFLQQTGLLSVWNKYICVTGILLYCSLCGGRESLMDSISGTSVTRSELRRSDRRELTSRVSERLLTGPQLPLDPVHRVTPAVLHLVLQQGTCTGQLPTRLRSRLLRDCLHCRAIVKAHSHHSSHPIWTDVHGPLFTVRCSLVQMRSAGMRWDQLVWCKHGLTLYYKSTTCPMNTGQVLFLLPTIIMLIFINSR